MRMNLRNRLAVQYFSVFLAGIVCAFMVQWLLWNIGIKLLPTDEMLATWHSRRLNRYIDRVKDHSNWQTDGHGLVFVADSYDVEPSLAFLVSSGRLEHVNVVFPTVKESAETMATVKRFVYEHPDIVFMEGNPKYWRFPVTGDPPLQLRLWFTKRGESDVRRLMEVIEQEFGVAPDNQNQ